MAAPIVTAGTSAEAQLIEIATAVNNMEKAQSTDLEPLANVTIDTDIEAGAVTITATIPVTVAATSTGFSVAAAPYLT